MTLTPPSLAMSPTQALGLEDILNVKRREAEQARQASVDSARSVAQGISTAGTAQAQGLAGKYQAQAAGTLGMVESLNKFWDTIKAQKAKQAETDAANALEEKKYNRTKQDKLNEEERGKNREKDKREWEENEKKRAEKRAADQKKIDRKLDADKEVDVAIRKKKAGVGDDDGGKGNDVNELSDAFTEISRMSDVVSLNKALANVVNNTSKKWNKKQQQELTAAIKSQINALRDPVYRSQVDR